MKGIRGRHHADWHPRKEKAHQQWAQHSVDQDRWNHGKRNSLRTGASMAWRGRALVLARTYDARSFLHGKGLRKAGRFVLYIQDKPRGRLDDAMDALAWCHAARKHGHDATCTEV